MNLLSELLQGVYAYLTEFIINLANLLNLSYYEVNFALFCLGFPIVTLVLVARILWQKKRLLKLRA